METKHNSKGKRFFAPTIAAGLALALALTFTACEAAVPSALVDIWSLVDGPASGNPEEMELLKDGTGIVDQKGVTWKTEKDRFYLTNPTKATSYSYKVQGSALTLIKDDGVVLKYKTKKSVEEERNAHFKTYKYKTVKIGEQTWMAENLNYNAFGSKCYDNNEENCKKYGRLYNWNTAKKVCPNGWHLPSKDEWQVLVDIAGGDEEAGKKLKAANGWNDSGNGEDKFGFSALPGGCGDSFGLFRYVGSNGGWWSASDGGYGSYNAYIGSAGYNYNVKGYLQSVRCLRD
ncbi:MAG: fibrobacter succinogenes major paralogous domain-containing protein [Fibromonadaceae bacterium]|jgi:uncharacterized protein (TIGR02145 family)|nr:fibrobacter succinogenes major paralogous domain-containing protein [Fibromonadaceae bacterium]